MAPHFIKVLNHVSTHLGLFEIPEKFVRRHGQQLGEKVLLKVPSGDSWNVSLEKDGGKIWFGSTWKNFVDRYSLLPGSPLLFRYEGNSTFHVVIFDQEESEIGYPEETETINRGFASPKIEDTSDDSSVEIMGDFTPGLARNHVRQFCSEADDESANSEADDESANSEADDESANSDSEYVPSVSRHRASPNRDPAGPSRQRAGRVRVPPRRSSLRPALAAANFESDYPFFHMTISRSYLYRPLVIPTIFLEKHNLTRHMEARLEFSGNPWPVNLRYYANRPQGCLASGWIKFTKDTNLQEGDICIFELIGRDPTVFKVTIIRCEVTIIRCDD